MTWRPRNRKILPLADKIIKKFKNHHNHKRKSRTSKFITIFDYIFSFETVKNQEETQLKKQKYKQIFNEKYH
jgi:hypothetical protein